MRMRMFLSMAWFVGRLPDYRRRRKNLEGGT
jgi:hypothetical protein